jgi:hypothetical protein
MDQPSPSRLSTRLLFGAIAGFAATAAMTSAMTRLTRLLPRRQRYPLPPREIVEALLPESDDALVRDTTMLAHFLYGASSGAFLAAVRPPLNVSAGAAAGVAVWFGSYFGWIPSFGILTPASRHPARRNALMISAHMVWGGANTLILRELFDARRTIMNDLPSRDIAVAHAAA